MTSMNSSGVRNIRLPALTGCCHVREDRDHRATVERFDGRDADKAAIGEIEKEREADAEQQTDDGRKDRISGRFGSARCGRSDGWVDTWARGAGCGQSCCTGRSG